MVDCPRISIERSKVMVDDVPNRLQLDRPALYGSLQENRAKVVMAEAAVPMAISQALANGKLGLMEYFELKNVQADTKMRDSIAGAEMSPIGK